MKIKKNKYEFLTKTEVGELLCNLEKSGIEDLETIKYTALDYTKDAFPSTKLNKLKMSLKERKLTDFEIIQLCDIWPKTLVCLQLIIEEMEERFQENELIGILDLFKDGL